MTIDSNYIALAVKDIEKSKEFYENIGFLPISGAGSIDDKWLLLKNGSAKIGLFEGMFPKNTITLNSNEVRHFHAEVLKNGTTIQHESESIKNTDGPCSFMINDPDGNPILFDHH